MLDLMELNTQTLFSMGDQAYLDSSVLQTGEFRLKSLNPLIISCSVSASINESGQVVYEWSKEGPVYGPNGLLQLDPDNQLCRRSTPNYILSSEISGRRPVFATCKNNCPGGE